MSDGVNLAILLGNLGRDAEMSYTQGGTARCRFSVATSKSWAKDGDKKERTEWHNIVLWGKLGEALAKYLKKGKKVYLEGEIQTRSWDDEKSGQKKYMTEINASKVILLGGEQGAGDQRDTGDQREEEPQHKPQTNGGHTAPDDDDIPF